MFSGLLARDIPFLAWVRLTHCWAFGHRDLSAVMVVPPGQDYCTNCGRPWLRRP